jgi:Cu+-exporting ATPase
LQEIKKTANPTPGKSHLYSTCNHFPADKGGVMATDPVCGMKVDEESTEFQSSYGGKDFNYCSEECEDKFEDDPSRYASAAA